MTVPRATMGPARNVPVPGVALIRPARLTGLVAATVGAALVAQPLTATPAHAGYNCGTPLAIGDCTPPETTITGQPAVDGEGETESRLAAFTFEAEDEDPADKATFECRLDQGETEVQDWTDCTDGDQQKAGHSTGSEAFTDLSPGSYTFSVRARDTGDVVGGPANTEATPATFGWTVVDGPPPPDTEHPDTVITAGARRWHPFSFLGIAYRSDEETSGYECTVNGRARSCDDDPVTFYGMKAGDYVFTVAAVDTAGNVDPTPAKDRWTVPMNNTLFKKHSGEWDKRTGRGHFQDTYSIADRRGAYVEKAKRNFRSLALVATRCPGCGKVAVFLRGDRLTTVDLSARKTRKRQILPIDSWRRLQTGRVRVQVVSQGKAVLIEGVGFSRRR